MRRVGVWGVLAMTACGDSPPDYLPDFTIAVRIDGGTWKRVPDDCGYAEITSDAAFEVVRIRDTGPFAMIELTRLGPGDMYTSLSECGGPSDQGPLETIDVALQPRGLGYALVRFEHQAIDVPPDDGTSNPFLGWVHAPSVAHLTSVEPQDFIAFHTPEYASLTPDLFIIGRDAPVAGGLALDFATNGTALETRPLTILDDNNQPLSSHRSALFFQTVGGAATPRLASIDTPNILALPESALLPGDQQLLSVRARTGDFWVDLRRTASGPITLEPLAPIDILTCHWSSSVLSFDAHTAATWTDLAFSATSAEAFALPLHVQLSVSQRATWPTHDLVATIDFRDVPGWKDEWAHVSVERCTMTIEASDPIIRRSRSWSVPSTPPLAPTARPALLPIPMPAERPGQPGPVGRA